MKWKFYQFYDIMHITWETQYCMHYSAAAQCVCDTLLKSTELFSLLGSPFPSGAANWDWEAVTWPGIFTDRRIMNQFQKSLNISEILETDDSTKYNETDQVYGISLKMQKESEDHKQITEAGFYWCCCG